MTYVEERTELIERLAEAGDEGYLTNAPAEVATLEALERVGLARRVGTVADTRATGVIRMRPNPPTRWRATMRGQIQAEAGWKR